MIIRYGLIGGGMMGQEHIRNLSLLKGAEVTAVADPDEAMRELSARLAGPATRAYADYRELISEDICDAFIIASPNDCHYQNLSDVLATDKPILCEKPVCSTVDDCLDILTLASRRTAPVWVAMEYRYMPPLQRLREELEKGVAGAPRMMTVREHRYPFLQKVGNWNRFNHRTGGTLIEKCCHFWDLMRLMLDSDPIRVFASAGADVNHRDETYGGRTPDIFDNAFVTLDFANGARGMVDLCMFSEGSRWQEVISVTGREGSVTACIPGPTRFAPRGQHASARLLIANRLKRQETIEEIDVDPRILAAGDHHGSTFYQHERFLKLVRSGSGKPDVTLDDGLWSVRIGAAAELSARTGEAIVFS